MFKKDFSTSSRGGSSANSGQRSGGYRGHRSGSTGGFRGGNSGGRRFGGNSRGGRGGGPGRFRKNIDVNKFINKVTVIEEAEVFVPEHKFADFLIDQRLKDVIAKKGYITPTPIQDRVIPHALQGQDVVGVANTGTGKTAAFLIPLINKILLDDKNNVMVVVPTRELADQINEELRSFTFGMRIYSTVCVGGASMSYQIKQLSRKQHFVIGTPGRLKDLIERKVIKMEQFQNIVLDEGDRMLDMGFLQDMKFIVQKMPANRQSMLFSATLSKEIENLVKDFLKNPITISVKTRETSKNIEQDIIRVPREKKFDTLCELLSQKDFAKVIIFGETKHGVENLAQELIKKGLLADAIHGNKTQGSRMRTLGSFKDNRINILVATDVAARGLDIKDISHVINYDIPHTHDDYVHRIGRTGRGNKKGKALTFV